MRNQSFSMAVPLLACRFGELRFTNASRGLTKSSPRPSPRPRRPWGATPPRLIDLLGVRPGPLGTLDKIVMRARRGRRDCYQHVVTGRDGHHVVRDLHGTPAWQVSHADRPNVAAVCPAREGCLTSVLLRCRECGRMVPSIFCGGRSGHRRGTSGLSLVPQASDLSEPRAAMHDGRLGCRRSIINQLQRPRPLSRKWRSGRDSRIPSSAFSQLLFWVTGNDTPQFYTVYSSSRWVSV